jgi:hypothetical protein
MPYGTVSADLVVGTNGNRISPENTFGFRNRIINGAMTIDQRNAGASVTNTAATTTYTLDRYAFYATAASKFTVQQNAGSVTPPVGFSNYMGFTSLSNNSPAATDEYMFFQRIEGFNTSDLAWGTANAKTITISAWVYSSLTGTFSGALANSAANRFYPFSYSIPTANTWTPISVTIAGDTTGTWVGATNGTGINVKFNLGTGSTYLGTAGAWTSTFANGVTGSVNVLGTNGATFYITGVQLEVGTNATNFDYRPYTTELQLCQRYFQLCGQGFTGNAEGTTAISINEKFQVQMRTAPSTSIVSGQSCYIRIAGGDASTASPTLTAPTGVINGIWTLVGGFTGLTSNSPIQARNSTTTSLFIAANAEL